MGKNKALILAVVVIAALAAASTAHAYYETWDGWFHEGTLYYNGNAYTRDYEGGQVQDSTYSGERDTFYTYSGVGHFLFVYSAGSDSIILYVGNFYGGKQTGQSGTKEGPGAWSGSAIRRKNTIETTWNYIIGTWGTTGDFCFDYDTNPPTYDASWAVYPTTTLTGGGISSGELEE